MVVDSTHLVSSWFRVAAVAAALFFSVKLSAQDVPEGGFKNALLTMGKSGKVTLTYSRWEEQVGKGNYTLVFFWASWCDECREEVPYLQSVQQEYAGKGLKVLGVPYGDEISDTMDAMTELGISFPQLVDVDDDLAGPFGFDGLPFIVLLGPDGKTVAGNLRGEGVLRSAKSCF